MKKIDNKNVKNRLPYDEKYASSFFVEKYVALWAYGYKNGIGYSEGLYRSINELGFSYLDQNIPYKILDVGCGVGRTTGDYARFFKNAKVLGIDNAKMMIEMARRINCDEKDISLDMGKLGFGTLSFKGEKIQNVQFSNIGLGDYYENQQRRQFDLITTVNFLDRTLEIKQDIEMIFNLLKQGGLFILSTPLNFSNNKDWDNYGSYCSFLTLIKDVGFTVDIKFDKLIYKEVIDARGATEEYQTVVMRLIKKYEK
jgi:SAM-dependent methyltransferase